MYGISFDDLYKTYQGYVINSQTEYEYMAYLTSFLAVLPGMHNWMNMPDYERNAINSGYPLGEIFGTQKLKDLNYSWKEDFRDDVQKYDEYNMISVIYVDGTYIVRDASGAYRSNYLTEYNGAQILSLNGRDPKDMCFEFLDRLTPFYDKGNDCFFRQYMFFNDGIGVKYEAELLMPDGTVKTIDLYDDPAFDISFIDSLFVYPDLFERSSTTASTEDVVTDIRDENYIPVSYKIVADAGRKTVYVNFLSFDAAEGDRLASDLQKALDSIDADNVIIDIRSNGGGSFSVGTEKLLPVIFSHDVTFFSEVTGGKNDNTRNYYSSPIYKLLDKTQNNRVSRTDKDHFYYTEDFSVHGNAKKNYKIYLLTSQNSFSSADVMTAVCKEYDNCVIVGTNTGGEGICGSPFECYLPNSGFIFVYTPTASLRIPEDGCTGIDPDIYIHQTVEEYITRADLKKQDIDADSYEVRQTWDNTLISVLDMIDNG